MVVLALDTTTRAGSVAVVRGADCLIERSGDPAVPHGRRLPGDVLDAAASAGVELHAVDVFAVASGPGAFTGLRIGIATIQGLAFASSRPVVGISALDALAHRAAAEPSPPGLIVAAWMDAARGEVFASLYQIEGGTGEPPDVLPIDGPVVERPDAVLHRWRERLAGQSVRFAGEGAVTYADLLRRETAFEPALLPGPTPLASTIARLAAERARAGGAGPPHALRPLYVRRPDAELARDRAAGSARPGAGTRS